MGSVDTDLTDPVLPVQEPQSTSAAKTNPSDDSSGADGSGASCPSLSKQEQVQKLKNKWEVMEVSTEPDDNLTDHETEVLVQEPTISSVASMRSGCADPTPSESSSAAGGTAAPWPRSFTEEDHVQNLKKNYTRAFLDKDPEDGLPKSIEGNPWFARVVAKLRANPYLDSSELHEIEGRPPFDFWRVPLFFAVLMADREMVEMTSDTLLERNKIHIDSDTLNKILSSALGIAISVGEWEIVDTLLRKHINIDRAGSCAGPLQTAALFARENQTEDFSKILLWLDGRGIDINGKDGNGYSAFYLAVAKGKTDIVKEFLRWEDKIKLNETCNGGPPPIQIAHEEGFTDIENALMQREDVKRYIDSAFRDRQAYVDAANAILVGAALIASVTFASWLQPPLNYTTLYHDSSVEYVDVQHNFGLGSFWVFNTLSFYFAIGTVVFGAHSVLPRRQLFITENVKKLSLNLLLTSILLAFSVVFVIIAFGIAGFIVLIPILRYQWYMIAPTILGGIVCIGSIAYLFKNVWENRPWIIRNRKGKAIQRYFDARQFDREIILTLLG